MAYFKKLFVNRYRGIRALKIHELKGVNLVVGDNNCGKTSVLEALQLLRTSGNLANVYRVSIIWLHELYEQRFQHGFDVGQARRIRGKGCNDAR